MLNELYIHAAMPVAKMYIVVRHARRVFILLHYNFICLFISKFIWQTSLEGRQAVLQPGKIKRVVSCLGRLLNLIIEQLSIIVENYCDLMTHYINSLYTIMTHRSNKYDALNRQFIYD